MGYLARPLTHGLQLQMLVPLAVVAQIAGREVLGDQVDAVRLPATNSAWCAAEVMLLARSMAGATAKTTTT